MRNRAPRRSADKDYTWLVDVEQVKLTPCVAARIAAEDKEIERRRRSYGLY
jgi:hypothetical protein